MAPIASLTVRVSAQIAELQSSFAEARKSASDFADKFEGIATRAAAVGAFFGTMAADIAGSVVRGIGGAVKDAIKYSTEFSNAFMGLSSTARAFGVSTEAATAAAKKLSADGMLPLKDSVGGLKNLLASGFNLEQSTRLMEAFKDSAAFGRQGALSFGDAVRSATEGVKNQNSANVDNAGVTKNLSVILGEAGFKLQDLSDKTKGASARQALYTGLLRETAAQQGDAARAAQTYSGQLTAMQTSYQSLLATWGDAITRNKAVMEVLKAVGEGFRWLTERLSHNGAAFNIVSDILGLLVRNFATVVRAVDFVQQSFNKMDTALRTTIKGVADNIKDLGQLLIDFLTMVSKIPGSSLAFRVAADEIRSLVIVQSAAAGISVKMGDAIKENERRSGEWSATLQGLAGKADALAQRIKETRGQTVDLGEATGPTTAKLEGMGTAVGKLAGKIKDFWKDSGELVETIKNLQRVLSRPELLDRVGKDIDKLVERAQELGIAFKDLPPIIRKLYEEGRVERFKAQLEAINTLVRDQLTASFAAFGKRVRDELDAATPAVVELLKLRRLEVEAYRTRGTQGIAPEPFLEPLPTKVFEELFGNFPEFASGLSNVIADALTRGSSVIAGAAQFLGQTFTASFQRAVQKAGGDLSKLSGTSKALGLAGMGIESVFTGYGIGEAAGSKTKGVLGGAASGALTGAAYGSVVPGIGTAIGAGVGAVAGAIGGFFGGRSAEKKAKEALAANKKALLEQYGGMEKLRALADKLGVNIQKAFDAKKPEQFEAAVASLNKAIEAHNKRLEGLQKALDGVNARATIFGKQFAEAFEKGDTAKLAEIAQRTQPEFERIGLMVRDTFAGLVKESGSAIKAIRDMAPAFSVLQSGVTDFGLTSTAVIDELLANFRLVTDEGLAPFFEAIEANGQVLQGLVDAKALSPEGFQAIATDIGQSLQSIVEKGGDVARTLALSQPVLQTLWEAQERYGLVTDETTQSLLRQAEEQGLVGAQMKDVNERILDVLMAIGKVLGADLPQAFKKLKTPAKEAADDIERSFNSIELKEFEIQYRYAAMNEPPVTATSVPGGEGVAPVVAPADLGVGSTYVTDVYLDGDKIARSTAKRMPDVLRTMGVG